MTRGEAERFLNLTEDYTLTDLKARWKLHVVKFHPDKFPDTPSDGQMSKAEAEREFIKGTHAFDALAPLFNGMPNDHKETPEAKWHTRNPYASTAEGGAGHGTPPSSGTSGANATTNAYTNGHADASDTVSEGVGATTRTTWEDFRAAYSPNPDGTGNKATGSRDTYANSRRENTTATRDWDGDHRHAAATNSTSYAKTGATGASSTEPARYTISHGGPLFWCIIVFGLLAIVFWNHAAPKEAFVSVVQFIFSPGKMLFLFAGLGFIYIKGW